MDDVFVCVHTCAALVAAVAVASEEVKDAVSSRTSRFSAGEKELNPQNLRVGGRGQQQCGQSEASWSKITVPAAWSTRARSLASAWSPAVSEWPP